MGILLICHDINLVLAYSDKIAHLNKELFLHTNTKEKKKFILKHLYENHSHFCDVEMSLNTCFAMKKIAIAKTMRTRIYKKKFEKTEFKKKFLFKIFKGK